MPTSVVRHTLRPFGKSSAGQDQDTHVVSKPQVDPLIGKILDHRFKIVELLGKGSMGRVYKATQAPLNRIVAVKILEESPSGQRDSKFRQRFLVEASLTAKLHHPNTVTVIDGGVSAEGIYYLAMEYLPGETLEQVLRKHGALPWRRVIPIFEQVARSVREAHQLGLVHRDLKPANIMLLKADEVTDVVKVLDFGLVKGFVEGHEFSKLELTKQGALVGSPTYMSPEQAQSKKSDPRTDIYALGVVIFEALSGTPPFDSTHPIEVLMQHVKKPVPALSAPGSTSPLPETLKSLVVKCLAKAPEDRFQSIDELLAALRDVTEGERKDRSASSPVVAAPVMNPVSVPAPAPRFALGIRGFTAMLAIFALCLGGLSAALITQRRKKLEAPLPAPPVAATAPSAITFHVDSEPHQAEVFEGETRLGVTPLNFTRTPNGDGKARLELTLKHQGYLPAQVVAGGVGSRVEVHTLLQPEPAPVAEPSTETPAAAKRNAKPEMPEVDEVKRTR